MSPNISAKFLALTTTIAFFTALPATAAEVEVMHFWTSGGEAKSVAELKKMLEAKGHKWKDFVVAGGGGGNAYDLLRVRALQGKAPAAAMIKGWSIQEWGDKGVLADLDNVAKSNNWDALLPPLVSNSMKYKGHYVAAPFNIHRGNWMWVNPDVFKKANVRVPTTWDEFADAAEKIQRAGFIPVAHGAQPWQDFMLFETVVLGVGGPTFYKKALVELDPAAIRSPTMLSALKMLRTVRQYTDKDASDRAWDVATSMVINGKAAMQFMGDWAKGEFTAAGKSPGKDFLCLPAPGTANSFSFLVDSFAMFTQTSREAQKGQADLSEAIMSPAFQEVFNLSKGSIPARLNMDMSKFDDCAKLASRDLAVTTSTGALVPSITHYMAVPTSVMESMRGVIARFANSRTMSPEIAMQLLASATRLK